MGPFKTVYHEKTYDALSPQSSYNPQSTLNTTFGFSGYYSFNPKTDLKINLGSEILLNINHDFEYQNLEAGEEITLDANLLKTELQYNVTNNFSVFSDQRIITIKSLHTTPSAYNENRLYISITGFEIGIRFKIF